MTPREAADWSPLASTHLAGPRRILSRGALETLPFQQQATAMTARLNQTAPTAEERCEDGLNHLTIVLALADPHAPLGRCLADLVAG